MFKIRHQVFLFFIALFIGSLLMGHRSLFTLERHLRESREAMLQSTACGLAETLQKHPSLFFRRQSPEESVRNRHLLEVMDNYNPLFVQLMKKNESFSLDGQAQDWEIYRDAIRTYTDEHALFKLADSSDDPLVFKHLLLKDKAYLYILFDVKDRYVRTDRGADLAIAGDHIQMILEDPSNGKYQRYAIMPFGTGGLVYGFRLPLLPEKKYRPIINKEEAYEDWLLGVGAWQLTPDGYILEMRIPLNKIGKHIGFAVADVDDPNEGVQALVSTSEKISWPGPALSQIMEPIHKLQEQEYAMFLIDRELRLVEAYGKMAPMTKPGVSDYLFWLGLLDFKSLPRFAQVDDDSPEFRSRPEISTAIAPPPEAQRYQAPDGFNAIIAGTCPVVAGGSTVGAVLLQQQLPRILLLSERKLVVAVGLFIGFLFLALAGAWIFASKLSKRIQTLRMQTEKAIGIAGTVYPEFIQATHRDELGELARSFAGMLYRIKQHHQYLQSLAGRLAHELRTPLAVVYSSLENVDQEEDPAQKTVYVDRARQGIRRLNTLISRLTEASRLEQAVQSDEKEVFNLCELVAGCAEGYRMIYPDKPISVDVIEKPVLLEGSPDMLAQLLDKLVSNATDFVKPGTAIEMRAYHDARNGYLEVANQGASIPEEVRSQLFNCMVSKRGSADHSEPHLGMGLYIVRLIAGFHRGEVTAHEYPGAPGVVFRIRMPLAEKKE